MAKDETALVVQESQGTALQLLDPDVLITSATKQANALAAVIEKRRLYATINGRKHVVVEGWQTLGALNGLQAFTERVDVGVDETGKFWANAVVSARRMNDGALIAQAEGFCSKAERQWAGRDEYAVRSMAQTRATSKVFRQAFAWVMVLAGYEATPKEEIPNDDDQQFAPTQAQKNTRRAAPKTPAAPASSPPPATPPSGNGDKPAESVPYEQRPIGDLDATGLAWFGDQLKAIGYASLATLAEYRGKGVLKAEVAGNVLTDAQACWQRMHPPQDVDLGPPVDATELSEAELTDDIPF